MDAIEIPIRISGVNRAQAQINNVGRQMAGLSRGVVVPVVAGGNAAVGRNAPRQPSAPRPVKTIGQQVKDAFLTSRVSVGAGGGLQFMPLVNRILPIFMRLNPVVSLATLTIGAMATAAKQAADGLNAFRAAQLTTAGTGEQTALLKALGIDPASARNFGQKIAHDPMASGFAARMGIYNPGGEIFGNINVATNFIQAIEELRKMPRADAIRAARVMGTEEALRYLDVSRETWSQLKKDAEQTARIRNPQQMKSAAEFEVQMLRLNSAFDDLKIQLGVGVIPLISEGTRILANSIRWLNEVLGIDDKMTRRKNPQVDALDRNTASLRELGTILKNGTYGGGDRARGAVPAGWTGMWYDKWSRNAIGLGAFEL